MPFHWPEGMASKTWPSGVWISHAPDELESLAHLLLQTGLQRQWLPMQLVGCIGLVTRPRPVYASPSMLWLPGQKAPPLVSCQPPLGSLGEAAS